MARLFRQADTPLPHDVTTGPAEPSAPKRPEPLGQFGRAKQPSVGPKVRVGWRADGGRDVAWHRVDRLGLAPVAWSAPGIEQDDLAESIDQPCAVDGVRPGLGEVAAAPAGSRARRS